MTFPPTPTAPFRSNRVLEQYVLTDVTPTGRTLGAGSYGRVLEVTHGKLNCAAKKMHDSLLQSDNEGMDNLVAKYEQECQIMASLRHPNITQFLGICYLRDTQLPLLVMEQLDMSLDDLLEYVPNLLLTIKVCVIEDVSRGLDYLHKKNPPIIHRDLTAKNVLITSSLTAKITDMGNSRIVSMRPGQLARTLSQLPGTLVYMPPEALSDDHRYGPSLDIFSLGHLALYIIIQEFPGILKPATYCDPNNRSRVQGRTEVERRSQYIQSLEESTSFYCETLVDLVKRCLNNAPEDRPSSEDLFEQIHAIRENVERSFGGSSLRYVDIGRVQLAKDIKRRQEKTGIDSKRQSEDTTTDARRRHDQLVHQEDELQQKTEEILQQNEIILRQKKEIEQLRAEINNTALEEVQQEKEELEHLLVDQQRNHENAENEMRSQLEEKNVEIESLQLESRRLHEQVQHQEEGLHSSGLKLQKQMEEILQQQQEIQQLREDNKHQKQEVESKAEEIRSLSESLTEIREKKEEVDVIIAKLKSSQKQTELDMKRQEEQSINEIENLRQQTRRFHDQIQLQHDEIHQKAAEIDKRMNEIKQMRDEIQKLKEDKKRQVNEMRFKFEEIIKKQKEQLKIKVKEVQNLSESLKKSQQQNSDLQKSLSESGKAEEELKLNISKLSDKLHHCQEELQATKVVRYPLQVKWISGPDMPFGMGGYIQSVIIQETMYVGGGSAWKNPANNYIIMAYNTHSNRWQKLPRYSARSFAMVVINNRLFLVGGEDNKDAPTNLLSVWDLGSRKWTYPYTYMHIARSGASAVAHKQWLIVAGGKSGDHRLTNVEVLDITNNQWYFAPSTPLPWSIMKSAVIKDMWYLMGGYAGEDKNGTDAIYSTSLPELISNITSTPSSHRHVWKKITGLGCRHSTPFAFDGEFLATGGVNVKDCSSVPTISRFVMEPGKWVDAGCLPSLLQNCACTVTSDNKIFIVGSLESSFMFYIGTLTN